MNSNTSIGPGPGKGGNEDTGNADGRGNKTLGEHEMPEPEKGVEEVKQPDSDEETVQQVQARSKSS